MKCGCLIPGENRSPLEYVSEFGYRRNMRASHSAMFDRLLVSLALPCLKAT